MSDDDQCRSYGAIAVGKIVRAAGVPVAACNTANLNEREMPY